MIHSNCSDRFKERPSDKLMMGSKETDSNRKSHEFVDFSSKSGEIAFSDSFLSNQKMLVERRTDLRGNVINERIEENSK